MATAQRGEAGFGDTMTPQQIYDNFMNAQGPGDLMQSQSHLTAVMSTYQDRVRRITRLAAAMEEGWAGDAAQAARRSAGPLAVAHDEAAMRMVEASQLIQSQTQAFYDTKNKVVPVPAIPKAPSTIENLITLGSANSGYEDKVKASMDAAQQNVTAMDSWSGTSSDNGSRMPSTYGSLDPGLLNITMTSPDTAPPIGGGGTGVGPNLGHAGLSGGQPALGMTRSGVPGQGGYQTPDGQARPGVAGFSVPPQLTTPESYTGPLTPGLPAADRHTFNGPVVNGPGGDWAPSGSFSGSLRPDLPGRGSGAGGAGAEAGTGSGARASGRLDGGATAGEKGFGTGKQPGLANEPVGRGGPAGAAGRSGISGMGAGAHGGKGKGGEDEEHQRKFLQDDDEAFQLSAEGEKLIDPQTGLPVTPPVIGR